MEVKKLILDRGSKKRGRRGEIKVSNKRSLFFLCQSGIYDLVVSSYFIQTPTFRAEDKAPVPQMAT